ncbi:hypothetical protein [Pontibacter mangrovi]|uniref:Uncharacterized protein n=1 Tax=Pontibacter mangrovi TaxID=2589816 RepID=A0A501W161_9BACT|nr:hypothetical protein [Pontibacter mangrovi]TPE42462.1 hypothetical protein FJM65_17805 [Pontibacter mangrovi]
MMNKILLPSLLLLPLMPPSCRDRKAISADNQERTPATVRIVPELHRELVTDNPTLDSVTYEMLLNAGFSGPEVARAAYAGSKVTYAVVGDTSLSTDELRFAEARLGGDTLFLYIKPASSLSETFGGWGIAVTVVGDKASSHYYEWSDIAPYGATVAEEYSRLTLSKGTYEQGDTVAGELFTRLKGDRYAAGYFRAIIE